MMIQVADKVANPCDLKSPPVGWSVVRMGAYLRFGERVAGGCAGVARLWTPSAPRHIALLLG